MEVARLVNHYSMREITSYLVVKKMSLDKKKLGEMGTSKERLQAEVINFRGKP